jgi:hypothetical protein
MVPSPEGLIVAALIALFGYLLGAPLTIGLLASLPFGGTAWASLPALGGSSPVIYTLFAIGIVLTAACRRTILADLGRVFTQFPLAWILLILTLYAIVSAAIFPRLFQGQTPAFIPIKGVIREVALGPASGNITQPGYFTLGALTFLALCVLMLRREHLGLMRRGFFAFVIIHASLGILDLASKLAGAGDILLPIRTANFALLTEVAQSGFWRIAGGFPEASGFGIMSLACLGFAYAYWRHSSSRFAFVLTGIMLVLVLLSTSSTAYGGLALLGLAPVFSLLQSALRNRFSRDDVLLTGLGMVMIVGAAGLYIANDRVFDPIVDLVDETILNKAQSDSGKERGYWNQRSLQNFSDTNGLGIGLGSSRSSSWGISVISQLGLIGSMAMAALVVVLLRCLGGIRRTRQNGDLFALAAGARASAMGGLVGAAIGGSSADPGITFMVCLAVIAACRYHALLEEQGSPAMPARPGPQAVPSATPSIRAMSRR